MSESSLIFNTPPGWPKPPDGWKPPSGWEPDPSWPAMPEGWQLWVQVEAQSPTIVESSISATAARNNVDNATRISQLESEIQRLRQQIALDPIERDAFVILDDDIVLQSVGIYRYHHPLECAVAYKKRLANISARITELVKCGDAIEVSRLFTYDNSLAKGRSMTADLSKLMLRAYNAEADNCIRSLRVGNDITAKKRLTAARDSIAKLGRMMEMHISDGFHALRLEEIELTSDWLMKKQYEKEAAREEKARLREERRVEKELSEEREQLEKERTHLERTLAALRKSGGVDAGLEARLAVIEEAIVQNDYRVANIRAGYVYVISNRGAFGEGVVKIGLTRRLEPLDRVNELSGASVPFRFDVHCIFFSEDAVTLENELHEYYAKQALNLVNSRKEFFFTTPAEVRDVLLKKVGNLLEFNEDSESLEYLQSVSSWQNSDRDEEAP